jgi:hypothetical protein
LAAILLAACGPQGQTTGEPTEEQSSSAAEAMQMLIEDDFSDPASGWKVLEEDNYAIQYQDGQLRIFTDNDNSPYVFRVAFREADYADVRIEVDVRQASGNPGASQGLVCRYQDGDNYVFADVDFDGNLRIGRFLADEQEILRDIEDFTGLQEGVNRLRLDCTSSMIEFYVNGEHVASAEVDEPASGGVGFYSGGSGQGQNEFFFDNFIVYQP